MSNFQNKIAKDCVRPKQRAESFTYITSLTVRANVGGG